jgi:hypothetical protein
MNQGRLPWRHMPEKSGIDVALCVATLAGAAGNGCAEARMIGAAKVASRSKCGCGFMVHLPFMTWRGLLRLWSRCGAVDTISKHGTLHGEQ